MRLRPRSLLTHVFLLCLALLALTNAAWWLMIQLDDSRPRGLAQFSASAVNLVRSALLSSDPELRPQLLHDLSEQEGIRLLPREPGDQIEPLPASRFHQATATELRRILGTQTDYALTVNHEPGLWISFALMPDDPDEFWLILPRNRANPAIPWHWLGWGMLSALCALTIAWLFASRVNRPLRRMMQAAQQVGRGHIPSPLPEEGPDELIRLARVFNRMARDLAYNEQERVEILAGISHDLRTPLTRLRLEAEMSLPEGPARTGMCADIEQMDAIIAQFLDYARGVGDKTTLVFSDPEALLTAIREHEAAIQRPLTIETPGELPFLPMKQKVLFRALQNLLNNAWKYGAPPVTLSVQVRDDSLCFSVGDCGEGIPETERERLKQPFTRRDTARGEADGTGLGLAIAERAARDHGGRLELATSKKGGLLATLVLPLRDDPRT